MIEVLSLLIIGLAFIFAGVLEREDKDFLKPTFLVFGFILLSVFFQTLGETLTTPLSSIMSKTGLLILLPAIGYVIIFTVDLIEALYNLHLELKKKQKQKVQKRNRI